MRTQKQIERHREYIRISNEGKPLDQLTKLELHILRKETPSFDMLFAIESELRKRGALKETYQEWFKKTTNSTIRGEVP